MNNETRKASATVQPKSAMDLAEDALSELSRFVAVLRSGEQGFMSRLIPASARDFGGEFDHLARVAEWASAENSEEAEDV